MSCLFCLLLTIPAPPSLAESRECCLVLLGLQAFNLLKCWRSGERVEGLTDVTGGPGVWGLPEMPAENMHACKRTNAAGLQRFLSSRAWSLSSILRKMTAPWCDSLWGLTKSHPLFIFLCSYLSSEVPFQFSSVAQSCLTLCNPMDCSMPGLPVHHHLPEFIQTHVH